MVDPDEREREAMTSEEIKARLQQGPSSTRKLRELRNAIMLATKDEPGCVTHSVTIHFFSDCWLGYHEKSNNMITKLTAKVYSKDLGKTWLPYRDQFEPAEGFHRAVQYNPSDASFPTKEW